MIRVLVVDDSPTMRELLVAILTSDPGVSVVATASDGDEAVEKAVDVRPDLITMDIRMPRYDGVAAIRAIMRQQPTPIVVLCSDSGDRTLNIGFNALKAGALEVIEKPHFGSRDDVARFARDLIATVKLMSEVHVVRLPYESGEFAPITSSDDAARPAIDAVGICSSTGGPAALEYLFRRLPATFAAPIVVVQHITEGFLHGLVDWLNRDSALEVRIAQEGERIQPGAIYFAPEHRHLALAPGGILVFRDDDPIRSHKPSGEILFSSLAECYGGRSMGVILTGMGEDGCDGLEQLARCGGIVLAQDEATSAIFGMPRAAIERRAATEVLALDRIAERIVYWTYGGPLGTGLAP
jgi:two-component system, chemotaxis family, protein-glutamate methylesterase/glutaminase